jgi:Flp pilus assembly protein TadG
MKRLRCLIEDFLRYSHGAVAVEFALVAPLFLTMFFAISAVSHLSNVSSSLDRAVSIAARSARVGPAPPSDTTLINTVRLNVLSDYQTSVSTTIVSVPTAEKSILTASIPVTVQIGGLELRVVTLTSTAEIYSRN